MKYVFNLASLALCGAEALSLTPTSAHLRKAWREPASNILRPPQGLPVTSSLSDPNLDLESNGACEIPLISYRRPLQPYAIRLRETLARSRPLTCIAAKAL